MIIETEQGKRYDISLTAINALAAAENAKAADDVFNLLANHVPRCHRNDVWQMMPTKKHPKPVVVCRGGLVVAVYMQGELTPIDHMTVDWDDINEACDDAQLTEDEHRDRVGTVMIELAVMDDIAGNLQKVVDDVAASI